MPEFDIYNNESLTEIDNKSNRLIMDYANGYTAVIALLLWQLDNDRRTRRQQEMLFKQVDDIISGLSANSLNYVRGTFPLYYFLSLAETDKLTLQLPGVQIINNKSGVVHRQALRRAQNDLYTDLARNTVFMSNTAKTIIRDNAKELLAAMIQSGDSYITVKADLRRRLEQSGIASFTDRRRRKWKISSYVDMAVRTKSRILHNEGTMNRLQEYAGIYGYNESFDTIQISSHGAKDWCRYYENKCFSISGNSQKYPSIETLPNRPFNSLHPNCKHLFLPYIPMLRGEGEIIDESYQNMDVNELNKIEYHERRKARN